MQPTQTSVSPDPDSSHSSSSYDIHIPRWAVLIGILATGFLYILLPEPLTFGPRWLLLAIEVVLIIPIIVAYFMHRRFSHNLTRILSLILLGTTTAALIIGVVLLIRTLPKEQVGSQLLYTALLLYSFNILVFALWYWEIDDNGPYWRQKHGHKAVDFMFPQQADGNAANWMPHFLDYLFLAFTGATAFSPTDTFPLTQRAKVLMMLEAIIALVIVSILAGRAVNIL